MGGREVRKRSARWEGKNMRGRGLKGGGGEEGGPYSLWLGLLSSSIIKHCDLCAYNSPLPIEWFSWFP